MRVKAREVVFEAGERKLPFTAEGFVLSFSLAEFPFPRRDGVRHSARPGRGAGQARLYGRAAAEGLRPVTPSLSSPASDVRVSAGREVKGTQVLPSLDRLPDNTKQYRQKRASVATWVPLTSHRPLRGTMLAGDDN